MPLGTKTSVLIPAGARTADLTGNYLTLDEFTEAVEVVVDLTSITRTTTGTLQVLIEASYDGGATFEAPAVLVGPLSAAIVKLRFLVLFLAALGLSAATGASIADSGNYFQTGLATAPAASTGRLHLKPTGYRALADMVGDTTAYNVTVTIREVTRR